MNAGNTRYSLTGPDTGNKIHYAGNGNVLTANDSLNGNWTYTYDDFNRLSGAAKTGLSFAYNYDRFGNRWQQNQNSGIDYQTQLTFNANNQINGISGVNGNPFQYDAAGNLLMDGHNCYSYDAENRLVSVVPETAYWSGVCGPTTAATARTYLYDPDGRRVAKFQNGSLSEQYYYDAGGHLIMDADGSGNTLRAEIYAGARHLATWNPTGGGTTYFNHADWLGTERVRSKSSGVACETIASLPFGDGMTTQSLNGGCGGSGDPSPNHFTGKERDSESGLDYFGARYNASSLGRFMSPDPVGGHTEDPQTLNKYSYVRNNPLTLTDPTGLDFYLSCDKQSDTCQKDKAGKLVQGQYVTDANGNKKFQATVVTSASLQDSNSGNTATVNEKGVQITTTDAKGTKSTAEGIFINKTDPAEIEGSGKLSGFDFHINSSDEKSGTLDAGTYSYEGSGRQPDIVKALTESGAFHYGAEAFGNPKHSGELNFRFSPGAHPELRDYGPSPHLLVPNNPKATIPVDGWNFHVDSHTGDIRHGACAWLGVGCK